MTYYSTKTYDHNEGLSCAFRQWRATHSHCQLIHGYSLAFKFVFGAHTLDDRNWVQDFGGLKDIKSWLKEQFDHTLCIAEDDPEFQTLMLLDGKIADIRVLPAVGCEKFAEHVYNHVSKIIEQSSGGRVWLDSVECREHGANSAIYQRD